MIIYNKKYFLIIEDIKDIDLNKIKTPNKFIIIYRSREKLGNINRLKNFRKICRVKKIQFFISNNFKLMINLNADGLYISAYNKDLRINKLKNTKFEIIGSAHNIKELLIKKQQGCSKFIFSRLFETNYKNKSSFTGVIKFNLLKLSRKEDLVPLGGIRLENLNKMKLVNSSGFVLMSEIKKKPAKIFSRLF